jgi:hypothetical protein
MAEVKPQAQYFSLLKRLWKAMCMDLQRDGEIFFFVVFRQGVKRDFEGRKSDIGRAAH